MTELITISKAEYLGLKRFRDDMARYWTLYRTSKNKRDSYEGYMIYNQIDGAPDARMARLAYWYQLKERRNHD